jgi:hypothetical protein
MRVKAAGSLAVRRNLVGFFRTDSGIARAAWRVLRLAGAIGLTALVVFHATLFWDRLIDGQLLDPLVALRWAAALGLTSALVLLRLRGVPLVTGRRAIVVWLLVVLLHWGVGPRADTPANAQGSSADLIFVLPSTAAAALVGVGLIAAALAARHRRPVFTCLCTWESQLTSRASSGWRPAGGSRAPPLQHV